MRIIAGRFKGTRLAAVGKGDTNAHLRPTTDRVRESLFNILANHVDFDGMRVLDLFAGTGALGLESLSRGAAHVTFVENGRTAQKILTDNIRITRSGTDTNIIRTDATKLPVSGEPCDIVFLDPPYGQGLGATALTSAQNQGWIAPDALIIWEENAPQSQAGYETLTQRSFGGTVVSVLSKVV
ncbi:MAG: 16S rRNA (guanine(966)-N(2))-methyltransferase RsmD [Pseudomonadota bacterium]